MDSGAGPPIQGGAGLGVAATQLGKGESGGVAAARVDEDDEDAHLNAMKVSILPPKTKKNPPRYVLWHGGGALMVVMR